MEVAFYKHILIFFILSICAPLWAAERVEFYQGIRQLGMGGAGIGVVNDETALLINPAGLGKLRDYIVTVVDPEITYGADNGRILPKGKTLAFTSPQDLLESLNKAKDRNFYGKLQLFPSFIFPNFGVGALAKYEVSARVDSVTNKLSYFYRNDLAGAASFNLNFFSGIIKIGGSGRWINRVEANEVIDATATNLTLKSMAKQGLGVAGDAGIIISAPVVLLPSLSLVARDIGGTRYNLGGGIFGGYPSGLADTKQTYDAAFSFFPLFSARARGSFTAEYRDVLNTLNEKDVMRRVHVGFEANFSDSYFIRLGMNQKYWTMGLELATRYYQFQIATYGTDIGSDQASIEDRRYAAKFVFRF